MQISVSLALVVITGIDIIIVLLLFLIFFGKDRGTKRYLKIKAMRASLEKMIEKSSLASQELLSGINEKTNALREVLVELSVKEKRLHENIFKADKLIQLMDKKEKILYSDNQDPYKKAMKLVCRGFTTEQVCKESGLVQGEVELIRDLFHNQSH